MVKSWYYRYEDLYDYVVRFFEHLQVPSEDAKIAADVLLLADLRGVNSHGIIRLHTYYGGRLVNGRIDIQSPIKTLRESPVTLALDGGNGLGQVVAHQAMQRCLEKAEKAGAALVTVRNSNHYGIAGYYAMMALPHDMIGISLTNSQPFMVPTYGRKALIGTNPIAVAVPAGKERPYVLDMATTIVPLGKIVVHSKAQEDIPEGWGIDRDGRISTDPNAVIDGGALLPLGGSDLMRGYKGYGLSLLVDILSGVLSGAAFADTVGRPNDSNPGSNVGHFFAAIKIEALRDLMGFKADMDQIIRLLKDSPKAEGQERIYIHGEKEFERAESGRKHGIPLMETVVASLQEAGNSVGVPFNPQPLGPVD
ncbi:MAG: Ldh family oxidoreductase [Anaerolineaceae bacterium]|nr:Ldh family oxidoreductase [Anaerolineaceae bacterium]